MKSSVRIVKKEKKSNEKMSRPYGGISFVLFLFSYSISFGIERTNNSRFGIRIVRKTKLKKLQVVNENDFYDVTSSHAEESANCPGKKKWKKLFKRNKVAPAPKESSSSSYLNVLTADGNVNECNSDPHQGSSCDLFCPEDDVPGTSGVGVKNEVIMNLTENNDWLDTGKCIEKKSALSNFLSMFKRRTTKDRKILI